MCNTYTRVSNIYISGRPGRANGLGGFECILALPGPAGRIFPWELNAYYLSQLLHNAQLTPQCVSKWALLWLQYITISPCVSNLRQGSFMITCSLHMSELLVHVSCDPLKSWPTQLG